MIHLSNVSQSLQVVLSAAKTTTDCALTASIESYGHDGTSAKFQGNGWIHGIQPTLTAGQTDAVNTGGIYPIPATAPALGTGFDSTAAQAIDLWVGFSISNSGNGIQMEQYTVDIV